VSLTKDKATAEALRALSRELLELVQDATRLGWRVNLANNKVLSLHAPRLSGQDGRLQAITIPRSERSINDKIMNQWHRKIRTYGDPAKLMDDDRLFVEAERAHDEPWPGPKAQPKRKVEDVQLPDPRPAPLPTAVAEAFDRARKAQQAINDLGAGPPGTGPVDRDAPEMPVEEGFPCEECGKVLPSQRALQGHVTWTHSKAIEMRYKGGRGTGTKNVRKKCPICGHMSGLLPHHLSAHARRGETKENYVPGTYEKRKARLKEAYPKKEGAKMAELNQAMAAQEALELVVETLQEAGVIPGTTARLQELEAENEKLRTQLAESGVAQEELRQRIKAVKDLFGS